MLAPWNVQLDTTPPEYLVDAADAGIMEHTSIDDGESPIEGVEIHRLSDPLETEEVSINRYRLGPGESLPAGLHTHADQEEVFVVTQGKAEFEVLLPPPEPADTDGLERYAGAVVEVAESEAVRFAPGDFQSGRNAIDDDTVILALGAPRGTDDIRLPVACPTCGHALLQLDTDGGKLTFQCPDCGTEHAPAPCPECGEPDLRVTLGDETVTKVECPACGADYLEPPVRS